MTADIRTIHRHATTSKGHLKRVNVNKDLSASKLDIDNYTLDTQVAIAEITFSGLVCEKNFSYNSISSFMSVIKNVVRDSEIVKNIKFYDKKVHSITTHSIICYIYF